jgi:hypothetical protein
MGGQRISPWRQSRVDDEPRPAGVAALPTSASLPATGTDMATAIVVRLQWISVGGRRHQGPTSFVAYSPALAQQLGFVRHEFT